MCVFRNVQISWVKLGWEIARLCLRAGANDCGGTLMEENISSASGEVAATSATPEELQAFILSEGRAPVERSTTYRVLRRVERIPCGKFREFKAVLENTLPRKNEY